MQHFKQGLMDEPTVTKLKTFIIQNNEEKEVD